MGRGLADGRTEKPGKIKRLRKPKNRGKKLWERGRMVPTSGDLFWEKILKELESMGEKGG